MSHARHGRAVIVVGEQAPAMSVAWARPAGPADSGFSVIFSEFDPHDPDDRTPSQVVCLHCLVADGDVQLGRGLDLARRFGQVDWDPDAGEWFVPGDDPDAVLTAEGRREARRQARENGGKA